MQTDAELLKTASVNLDGDVIIMSYSANLPDTEENVRLANLMVAKVVTILDKDKTKKYKLMIDLSPLGKIGSTPSESRRIYAEMGKNPQLTRAAIVGGNLILRTVASFILKFAGRENDYRWFENKKEALNWLKT